MQITKTSRGFDLITFKDLYHTLCSLQKSSLASEDAIWFGVDDVSPRILASKIHLGGTGWLPYPISSDVEFTTRMHLSREQVAQLIIYLQHFADTGELVGKENGKENGN